MKANRQHLLQDSPTQSFKCYWVRNDAFDFYWHFHPEFEITYVYNGQGTRLVGDNTADFTTDDLVFLGSNLPHTWISDDEFNSRPEQMEVVVVQFSESIFPPEFLNMPEMTAIRRLIKGAERGLAYPRKTIEPIKEALLQLPDLQGFPQLNSLMNILHYLGKSTASAPVASKYYTPQLNRRTEERLVRVCQYLHSNYTDQIRLSDLAEIANMNETAFCRFFRKMTGQAFVTYVNDLRIGKACNQLIEDRKNISEIAYSSGFNSLTHFNRSFLKRKGLTPKQFRDKFRQAGATLP